MSFTSQVRYIGCDLLLNTPAAQTFSLVIHELATNAVKHGALGRPGGQVTIQGRIESWDGNDVLRFSWTEAGGPAVEQPRRRGFGSSILSGMAKRFALNVELIYRPEGFIYELQVLLASIQATPKTSSISGSVNSAAPRNAEPAQAQNESGSGMSALRPILSA